MKVAVYYIDGTKEVATAEKNSNFITTKFYDQNNNVVSTDVSNINLDELATSLDESELYETEESDSSSTKSNPSVTKAKHKLPAPKETKTHLVWKLTAKQAEVFIAMINLAAAVATLVAAIAAAISLYTGMPIAGKIAIWAGIIGAAFWVMSARAQLQRALNNLNGKNSLTIKISKQNHHVSFA